MSRVDILHVKHNWWEMLRVTNNHMRTGNLSNSFPWDIRRVKPNPTWDDQSPHISPSSLAEAIPERSHMFFFSIQASLITLLSQESANDVIVWGSSHGAWHRRSYLNGGSVRSPEICFYWMIRLHFIRPWDHVYEHPWETFFFLPFPIQILENPKCSNFHDFSRKQLFPESIFVRKCVFRSSIFEQIYFSSCILSFYFLSNTEIPEFPGDSNAWDAASRSIRHFISKGVVHEHWSIKDAAHDQLSETMTNHNPERVPWFLLEFTHEGCR